MCINIFICIDRLYSMRIYFSYNLVVIWLSLSGGSTLVTRHGIGLKRTVLFFLERVYGNAAGE